VRGRRGERERDRERKRIEYNLKRSNKIKAVGILIDRVILSNRNII
jgi:hypothetical protein